jgi:hypothetical protein
MKQNETEYASGANTVKPCSEGWWEFRKLEQQSDWICSRPPEQNANCTVRLSTGGFLSAEIFADSRKKT